MRVLRADDRIEVRTDARRSAFLEGVAGRALLGGFLAAGDIGLREKRCERHFLRLFGCTAAFAAFLERRHCIGLRVGFPGLVKGVGKHGHRKNEEDGAEHRACKLVEFERVH